MDGGNSYVTRGCSSNSTAVRDVNTDRADTEGAAGAGASFAAHPVTTGRSSASSCDVNERHLDDSNQQQQQATMSTSAAAAARGPGTKSDRCHPDGRNPDFASQKGKNYRSDWNYRRRNYQQDTASEPWRNRNRDKASSSSRPVNRWTDRRERQPAGKVLEKHAAVTEGEHAGVKPSGRQTDQKVSQSHVSSVVDLCFPEKVVRSEPDGKPEESIACENAAVQVDGNRNTMSTSDFGGGGLVLAGNGVAHAASGKVEGYCAARKPDMEGCRNKPPAGCTKSDEAQQSSRAEKPQKWMHRKGKRLSPTAVGLLETTCQREQDQTKTNKQPHVAMDTTEKRPSSGTSNIKTESNGRKDGAAEEKNKSDFNRRPGSDKSSQCSRSAASGKRVSDKGSESDLNATVSRDHRAGNLRKEPASRDEVHREQPACGKVGMRKKRTYKDKKQTKSTNGTKDVKQTEPASKDVKQVEPASVKQREPGRMNDNYNDRRRQFNHAAATGLTSYDRYAVNQSYWRPERRDGRVQGSYGNYYYGGNGYGGRADWTGNYGRYGGSYYGGNQNAWRGSAERSGDVRRWPMGAECSRLRGVNGDSLDSKQCPVDPVGAAQKAEKHEENEVKEIELVHKVENVLLLDTCNVGAGVDSFEATVTGNVDSGILFADAIVVPDLSHEESEPVAGIVADQPAAYAQESTPDVWSAAESNHEKSSESRQNDETHLLLMLDDRTPDCKVDSRDEKKFKGRAVTAEHFTSCCAPEEQHDLSEPDYMQPPLLTDVAADSAALKSTDRARQSAECAFGPKQFSLEDDAHIDDSSSLLADSDYKDFEIEQDQKVVKSPEHLAEFSDLQTESQDFPRVRVSAGVESPVVSLIAPQQLKEHLMLPAHQEFLDVEAELPSPDLPEEPGMELESSYLEEENEKICGQLVSPDFPDRSQGAKVLPALEGTEQFYIRSVSEESQESFDVVGRNNKHVDVRPAVDRDEKLKLGKARWMHGRSASSLLELRSASGSDKEIVAKNMKTGTAGFLDDEDIPERKDVIASVSEGDLVCRPWYSIPDEVGILPSKTPVKTTKSTKARSTNRLFFISMLAVREQASNDSGSRNSPDSGADRNLTDASRSSATSSPQTDRTILRRDSSETAKESGRLSANSDSSGSRKVSRSSGDETRKGRSPVIEVERNGVAGNNLVSSLQTHDSCESVVEHSTARQRKVTKDRQLSANDKVSDVEQKSASSERNSSKPAVVEKMECTDSKIRRSSDRSLKSVNCPVPGKRMEDLHNTNMSNNARKNRSDSSKEVRGMNDSAAADRRQRNLNLNTQRPGTAGHRLPGGRSDAGREFTDSSQLPPSIPSYHQNLDRESFTKHQTGNRARQNTFRKSLDADDGAASLSVSSIPNELTVERQKSTAKQNFDCHKTNREQSNSRLHGDETASAVRSKEPNDRLLTHQSSGQATQHMESFRSRKQEINVSGKINAGANENCCWPSVDRVGFGRRASAANQQLSKNLSGNSGPEQNAQRKDESCDGCGRSDRTAAYRTNVNMTAGNASRCREPEPDWDDESQLMVIVPKETVSVSDQTVSTFGTASLDSAKDEMETSNVVPYHLPPSPPAAYIPPLPPDFESAIAEPHEPSSLPMEPYLPPPVPLYPLRQSDTSEDAGAVVPSPFLVKRGKESRFGHSLLHHFTLQSASVVQQRSVAGRNASTWSTYCTLYEDSTLNARTGISWHQQPRHHNAGRLVANSPEPESIPVQYVPPVPGYETDNCETDSASLALAPCPYLPLSPPSQFAAEDPGTAATLETDHESLQNACPESRRNLYLPPPHDGNFLARSPRPAEPVENYRSADLPRGLGVRSSDMGSHSQPVLPDVEHITDTNTNSAEQDVIAAANLYLHKVLHLTGSEQITFDPQLANLEETAVAKTAMTIRPRSAQRPALTSYTNPSTEERLRLIPLPSPIQFVSRLWEKNAGNLQIVELLPSKLQQPVAGSIDDRIKMLSLQDVQFENHRGISDGICSAQPCELATGNSGGINELVSASAVNVRVGSVLHPNSKAFPIPRLAYPAAGFSLPQASTLISNGAWRSPRCRSEQDSTDMVLRKRQKKEKNKKRNKKKQSSRSARSSQVRLKYLTRISNVGASKPSGAILANNCVDVHHVAAECWKKPFVACTVPQVNPLGRLGGSGASDDISDVRLTGVGDQEGFTVLDGRSEGFGNDDVRETLTGNAFGCWAKAYAPCVVQGSLTDNVSNDCALRSAMDTPHGVEGTMHDVRESEGEGCSRAVNQLHDLTFRSLMPDCNEDHDNWIAYYVPNPEVSFTADGCLVHPNSVMINVCGLTVRCDRVELQWMSEVCDVHEFTAFVLLSSPDVLASMQSRFHGAMLKFDDAVAAAPVVGAAANDAAADENATGMLPSDSVPLMRGVGPSPPTGFDQPIGGAVEADDTFGEQERSLLMPGSSSGSLSPNDYAAYLSEDSNEVWHKYAALKAAAKYGHTAVPSNALPYVSSPPSEHLTINVEVKTKDTKLDVKVAAITSPMASTDQKLDITVSSSAETHVFRNAYDLKSSPQTVQLPVQRSCSLSSIPLPDDAAKPPPPDANAPGHVFRDVTRCEQPAVASALSPVPLPDKCKSRPTSAPTATTSSPATSPLSIPLFGVECGIPALTAQMLNVSAMMLPQRLQYLRDKIGSRRHPSCMTMMRPRRPLLRTTHRSLMLMPPRSFFDNVAPARSMCFRPTSSRPPLLHQHGNRENGNVPADICLFRSPAPPPPIGMPRYGPPRTPFRLCPASLPPPFYPDFVRPPAEVAQAQRHQEIYGGRFFTNDPSLPPSHEDPRALFSHARDEYGAQSGQYYVPSVDDLQSIEHNQSAFVASESGNICGAPAYSINYTPSTSSEMPAFIWSGSFEQNMEYQGMAAGGQQQTAFDSAVPGFSGQQQQNGNGTQCPLSADLQTMGLVNSGQLPEQPSAATLSGNRKLRRDFVLRGIDAANPQQETPKQWLNLNSDGKSSSGRSTPRSTPRGGTPRRIGGEKREVPDSWEENDLDNLSESGDYGASQDDDSGTEDCCGGPSTESQMDWYDMKPHPGQLKASKWTMSVSKQSRGSSPKIPFTSVAASGVESQARQTKRAKCAKPTINGHNVRFRPGVDNDDDDGSGEYDVTDWKTKFMSTFAGVKVPYIDSHCHLDFLYKRIGFAGTFEKYRAVNSDTFPAAFEGCIAVFCNPGMWTNYESEGSIFQSVLRDKMVWGTVGCHPKQAAEFDSATEVRLRAMLQHERVVALGEIGLDYSSRYFVQLHDIQKVVLQRQVQIALELNLPIVIHSRDAEVDTILELEKMVPRNYRIHRHCFTGSWSEAEVWLKKFPSSFIGLTPLVTHANARSAPVREVARHIPLDRLLLETDTPYFIPRQVPNGEWNNSHPGMAITVAHEVALLRGIPIEDVLMACHRNTKLMYDI